MINQHWKLTPQTNATTIKINSDMLHYLNMLKVDVLIHL
jgi:hypothetical protein